MKTRYVTYNYQITCEVTPEGVVIPCGAIGTKVEGLKKEEKYSDYPPDWKILMIWFGKYFSYPTIGETYDS